MNTSKLILSNETKQKVYLVGIVGAGDVGHVARQIGCDESNIILVENEKDIPFLELAEQNEKRFKITDIPLLEMPKSYDFEFERKRKKPKNENWQNRMKQLQRR